MEVRRRWDAGQRDTGFAEEFSFRCSCCGLLEVCDELAYLCRDEPEDCYASAELDRPAVYFGGHVDCMSKRLLSPAASGELPRGTEYVFSAEDADMLFKRRGMFFPHALCRLCQSGKGRAVFSFYSFDMKIRSQRGLEKKEADKNYAWQVVSSLRSLFPIPVVFGKSIARHSR